MDYQNLYNLDLEQTVLGAMIISKDCAETGVQILREEDFFKDDKANIIIFNAMKNLYENDYAIDATSLINQLTHDKTLDKIPENYIGLITSKVVLVSDFEDHVRQLQDFTLLRKLVEECNKIINHATTKEIASVSEFLAGCEVKINDITTARSVSQFRLAKEIAAIVGEQIQLNKGGDHINGLETGYRNLDVKLDGFGKGQMIVLAARPGVGKSALALNISYNVAHKMKKAVAYFSLEMSNEELMRRLFSLSSGLDQSKINGGYLNKDERALIKGTQNDISKSRLYFEESTVVTIDDVVIKCKKLKEKVHDLSLVVIDHIAIIQEGAKKYSSEQEKVQDFARRLKQLALDLDIPILVVCHINRDSEKNKNKGRSRIPELSELRGSGEIENSADKVLLMYREGYYTSQGIDVKNTKGFGDDLKDDTNIFEKQDDKKGQKVDIIIAKNRQGLTGKVPLFFFLATGRFSTPSDETSDAFDNMID